MKIKKNYIPGKEEFEFREFRYVQINSDQLKSNFLNKLASAHQPIIPKNGGLLSENFIVITPNNERFYGISYSKDIVGWRHQIEKASELLNVKLAKIEDGKYFNVLNFQIYNLEDCFFERYDFYDEDGKFITDNIPVDKNEVL